jgi:hypothetical protein
LDQIPSFACNYAVFATPYYDLHTQDVSPGIVFDNHEPDGFLATTSACPNVAGDSQGQYGNVPSSWRSFLPVYIQVCYNMIASCASLSGDYVVRSYHNDDK